MGCILIELYTGEMFFSTHENVEHLAMIEKSCGVIPEWMATKSAQFRDLFESKYNKGHSGFEERGSRLRWPQVAKNRDSRQNVDEMKMLEVI